MIPKQFFSGFEIPKDIDFEKYMNQYNTISVNMQEFLSRSSDAALVERMKNLSSRSEREYPDVDYFDDTDLMESMQDVYEDLLLL